MFTVSRRVTNLLQRVDSFSDARTVCARPPRLTTGSVCRKSPATTIDFPPKGDSTPVTSRNIASRPSR